MEMKLTILVDNNTFIDQYFIAEPAFSAFIEADGKRILFDTGYSDAVLKNAQKLAIDLRNLDFIALSHGHVDHTWGLFHLVQLHFEARLENLPVNSPTIIAHKQAFQSKLEPNIGEIGSIISEKKLSHHFRIKLSREPVWITENLVFLSTIPRYFDYEGHDTIGFLEDGTPDNLIDDSALVYKMKEGLIIIVGCAHAGICNIVEYAKKICGDDRIVDIIGGFHLLQTEKNQLDETVNYFKQLKPLTIHACHCTDLRAKIALSRVTYLQEVGVGLKLSY
ncbi:MBL fold metallo-hydrolase [Brevibacillus daliensis]|uniref:MBL fold metallo-hydrolase n=1 Tax=Brevibacillus daliensis TaxID=2892995 RepID=UPI001E3720B6|nr:MBL fold metallo-hydrolase [Brevibacillus daliensis]